MNKVKIIAIIEIIFGIVLISNYILVNKKLKDFRRNEIEKEDQIQMSLISCEKEKRFLFDTWKNELKSNCTVINRNLFVENKDFETMDFQKIISGGLKLVFRITDNVSSCYDCKVKVLNQLDKIKEVIGVENIIILGRYGRMRDLIITKERENIPFNIYNYSGKLNIYADQHDQIDYLFVIDENLEAKLTFIATNVNTEKIEEYFNKINKWFIEYHTK